MVEDLNIKSISTDKKSSVPKGHCEVRQHWYSPPEPIRRVFDRFPFRTYSANILPHRSPQTRRKHVLHIFTSDDAARRGRPSHNPACLKWQAYLKFRGINFITVASNNHASPSGSLPFLLPAESSTSRPGTPVPSGKIIKWTSAQTGRDDQAGGMRGEAYSSLLDHRVRSAWLYHLYLDPDNFQEVAGPLYITTASSSTFVKWALGKQLQQAAREELAKYTSVLDGQELLAGADVAFESLSILLGDDEFFFAHEQPGLFDASVFAYTYLLVGGEMNWENRAMAEDLKKYDNLVQHQRRLHMSYFQA